jgi:hypothetical protein
VRRLALGCASSATKKKTERNEPPPIRTPQAAVVVATAALLWKWLVSRLVMRETRRSSVVVVMVMRSESMHGRRQSARAIRRPEVNAGEDRGVVDGGGGRLCGVGPAVLLLLMFCTRAVGLGRRYEGR